MSDRRTIALTEYRELQRRAQHLVEVVDEVRQYAEGLTAQERESLRAARQVVAEFLAGYTRLKE